jgi:protein SCO1/2
MTSIAYRISMTLSLNQMVSRLFSLFRLLSFSPRLVMGLLLALAAGGLASCGSKPEIPPSAVSSTQTNTLVFQVKGVVKKLEPDGKTVVIQHEAVPNYMPAMTMPFEAKDPKELAGLQPGDVVSFRMTVAGDAVWIDQIQKTGVVQMNETPSRPSVRLVRDVEPLKEGDVMTDYRFTNELGKAVSLSEFKGKALVLTFIFTRCPMPNFCPLMSKHFATASEQLKNRPDGPSNWHLFSISFDPHFDTPAVLRNYAKLYKYDPAHWSFVTGAMIDIDAITEQFNLPIIKQGENWDHKLRTVVIDAVGHVQKILVANQWKPEELVEEIVKAAAATEKPNGSSNPATPASSQEKNAP